MSDGFDHHEHRRDEQHDFNAIVRGHRVVIMPTRVCDNCSSACTLTASDSFHCDECEFVTTKESEARERR